MTGEPDRGDGLRRLTEITNAGQGAGSFSFDEATMRSLVTAWRNLADSYETSRRNSVDMMTVLGPGLDFASRGQAHAASTSGEAYLRYLSANHQFCSEQADLLQKALNDYLGVEDSNAAEIDKTGSHGPQPGI